MKNSENMTLPSVEELEAELNRVKYKNRYMRVLRTTIYTLITVAAVAVLVATLWMPVLQIYGTSMSPTLSKGDITVSTKAGNLETGDIVAFYYNNKILVKRVIARAGEWVDIDEQGNVYVNGVIIDEPYVVDKAMGECDIKLPYQVPESKIFVMGDNRSTSVDSRSTTIGCIDEEEIVGKIIFRIWPLSEISQIG